MHVAPDGGVAFYIVEKVVDDWTLEIYDAFRYESDKVNKNPVQTLRRMHRELATYVAIHQPPVLYFTANTDKKLAIYKTLLTKFPPAGYTCVEWEDTIYLYKLLKVDSENAGAAAERVKTVA